MTDPTQPILDWEGAKTAQEVAQWLLSRGLIVCEKVTDIIGPDEIVEGSLTGMLEWLNIHNNNNTFHIYPITGPTKVNCHFTKEWRDTVINGIDKNVTVYGELRYKKRENFPYAVNVRHIEIHPDDSELPTLGSLRGMMVNQTGLGAADFIRSLRDAEHY